MKLRHIAPLILVALALLVPTGVSAKNDHKMPVESPPFDDASCGFLVHIEATTNKEKETQTLQQDGSFVISGNGAFKQHISNPANGKSVDVNASGPYTYTFSPDGEHLIADVTGRNTLSGPNLVDFGYPSNFIATAGPVHFTVSRANAPAFDSVSGGNVLLDICAALA